MSAVFEPAVLHWGADIIRWAQARDLDPNLVATVMQIESCGLLEARSNAGAQGLFQVMPFHFGDGEDPLDPETNARRGLDYLQEAFQLAEGDLTKTLAGYNGGHSRIFGDPQGWPEETQRYVYWGTGIMRDISQGSEESSRLQEWLEAGGYSLCNRAHTALSLP